MNSAPDFKTRYAAILDVYGLTPSDLADLLQEPIAKFYKYRDGKAEPRDKLLRKMLEKMPDLSPAFLYEGVGPVKVARQATHTPTTAEDGTDWKARYVELEAKYNTVVEEVRTWATRYDALMGKYEKVMDKLMRKLDPSFSESDSQFTVYTPAVRALIGFNRSEDAECIVRIHPATAERSDIRVLNSLAPFAQQG